MATEAPHVLKLSLVAGADLHTKQYLFVKLDSTGRAVVAAAATDNVIGVLQNKPTAAGQMAEVVVIGRTKIVSSGAITVGNHVGTDSTGKAQEVTLQGYGMSFVQATKKAVGMLQQAVDAASADLCTVVINCLNPVPGT